MLLEVSDLCVTYGRVTALRGISLGIDRHECVGVLGANRAGKTTLARAISRLVQPKAGEIRWQGRVTGRMRADEIPALGVAHVPEGRQIFKRMTVEENLLVGALTPDSRPYRAESLERIYDLFPRLGERKGQMAGTLSGGEQQMVAIGRALMLRPQLLILDEPSLGLAPIVVQEVYRTVATIRREGIAILLVEQNVALALDCIDRGYVLENGNIAVAGSAAELRDSAAVREAYLGL